MNTPKRSKKKRWLKRLAVFFCCLLIIVIGAYFWQPYRIDIFPRPIPKNQVLIDPDTLNLFRKGVKVTVITAHPDDSEFYIGGLLTKLSRTGAAINLIVCTRGDKSYNPFKDHAAIGDTRVAEQIKAAGLWHSRGALFLSSHDGRMVATVEVVEQISDALRQYGPDYILCFDSMYPPRISHRDHGAGGEAAERAVLKTGVGKWIMRFSTRAPNYVADVTNECENKKKLLHIHKSEFYGEKRDRIDAMITRNAMGDGARINVTLGEGLRCTRLNGSLKSSSPGTALSPLPKRK
jgi:LmbE family N-acetylglucosaminyl deacetylase